MLRVIAGGELVTRTLTTGNELTGVIRVRSGLPEGVKLVGASFDFVRSVVILIFDDGQPEVVDREVIFEREG